MSTRRAHRSRGAWGYKVSTGYSNHFEHIVRGTTQVPGTGIWGNTAKTRGTRGDGMLQRGEGVREAHTR